MSKELITTKTDITVRSVPANTEAEQCLLGAILVNNEELGKVSDFLEPDHFYQAVHKRIYDSILKMVDKGVIANPISLKSYFDKDPALSNSGGGEYLMQLASLAATIINIHDYGHIIYDNAIKRSLIQIGEDIVNDAFDMKIDDNGLAQLEKAESKLFDLAVRGSSNSSGFKHLRSSILENIDRTQKAFKNKNLITGISSGFLDLNHLLGGFHNSDLVILAGRPSMGKTGFAINLALNAAADLFEKHLAEPNEKPGCVGFFSLEMSAEQISMRMLSMYSEIDSASLRNGFIKDDEMTKLAHASKMLSRLPLFIDDSSALTISAIKARARRLKRKNNLSILFIDYLQLIRGANSESRVSEITEITQGLKNIAKELQIPVIALSQLSRAVEQREDKQPLLSDLRDSGSIEQDADIVMFIYREEYDEARREPEPGTDKHVKWQEKMQQIRNAADIIVAKHRNGPIGTVRLYSDNRYTKFTDFLQKRHN